jgi:hypothetical protein
MDHASKAVPDWVVARTANRIPADRRSGERDQFTAEIASKMLEAVARRMRSAPQVVTDLSGWPDGPSVLAGAVVSLYRLARQAKVRTTMHGLDTTLVREVSRIGGRQFNEWLAIASARP